MTQSRIDFDAAAARAAANTGMANAAAGASTDWREWARRAIRQVCADNETFIVDAVRQQLDEWEVPPPDDARALGPMMREAVKAGICVGTSEYRPSASVKSHSNPRRVWRSNLYASEAREAS